MTAGKVYGASTHMREDGTWVNWHGNVTCVPETYALPRDEYEVQEVVRQARAKGLPVRVAGSGHSCTPLNATPGVLIHLDNMRGMVDSSLNPPQFTALAGTQLFELGPDLWDRGLSLSNMGDIDVQTIGGATGTGVHGSGVELGSISSSVRAIRLVNGLGEIVDIDETQPDLLHAAALSIGMLGVVTQVTMAASPAYLIEESVEYPSLDSVLDNWDSYISTYRHFSFVWAADEKTLTQVYPPYPSGTSYRESVRLKLYRSVEPGGGGTIRTEYGHRLDRSYRIYAEEYDPTFVEMEYMIPFARAREALSAFQKLINDDFLEYGWAVFEARFVAADDVMLSPMYGTPVLVVAVGENPDEEKFEFMRSFEKVAQSFGGRPHWGKLHFLSKQQVRAMYPRYDDFVAIRRQFDPDGLFLNEHLRELFE